MCVPEFPSDSSHLNYQQGYCLLLLVIACFITLVSPDYHGDNREESSQCDHVYWPRVQIRENTPLQIPLLSILAHPKHPQL